MSSDDAGLTQLAGAILDGAPVDWEAVDSGVAPRDRPFVTHLRAIAAIAEAHRGNAPETWGPLRLLEPIGRGAFGDVYRAWDSRLDREVALKLLPADPSSFNQLATSIIEEGRLLARIRHPNVVTVHGAELIGDRVGLWMEYVDGRTLHQLVVDDGRRFTPREIASIGHALCSAVAAVHAAGLLHRDVKAQNVMMARDGRVVLMDFGSGRDRDGASAANVEGTPLYLAPEVLAGASGPSVQSDIYSIGVLLFFLLTGSYPVTGADLAALCKAHERGERRALRAMAPKVPRRLLRSIERAIDPRPERRQQSADDLAEDLASVGRRSGRMAPFVAVAAAAIALISWMVVTDRRRDGAGVAARPQAIAVLPFENLSTEADSEQFADGLTYEIHRYLAGIEGLDLRSATSSFAFKNKPRDLAEIRKELDVDYVIEGSILKAGNKVRVIPRLTRVADDTTVWTNGFDREIRDVFATLDEISLLTVNSLRLQLGRGQRRYETDPESYAQFLKARGLRSRGHPVNSRKAAELFEAIVAKDPSFAPAWAGLASAIGDAGRIPRQDELPPIDPRMEAAALKAIQIDPLLAEAHAAMGIVYSRNRDLSNAQTSFLTALELNPSLTSTHADYVVNVLLPMGRVSEALSRLEEARRRDPLSLDVRRVLVLVQIDAERFAQAIENSEWILARDPDLPFVRGWLGRALTFAGRTDEALPILESYGDRGYLGYLYAVTGRRREAEALAATLQDNPRLQMLIFAGLRDKDRAFDALERTAERNWWRAATWMIRPEMKLLRGDPRLADLRKRMGLPPLEDR